MSQVASGLAEHIIGASLTGAEALFAEIRRDVVRAVSAQYTLAPFGSLITSAEKVFSRVSPLAVDHLADTEVAGWIGGMDSLAQQFPPWLWDEFTTGVRSMIAPPPPPPEMFRLLGMFDDAPRLRLPLIEQAAERLSQRNVLTRSQWDATTEDARDRAFMITGDITAETIDDVRTLLTENIAEGTSLASFRELLGDRLETSGIGPGRIENIYRTNVQAAFRDGRETLAADSVVSELFPYQAYLAIHDARTRTTHHQLELLGLSGTNIYRRDDPFWDYFTPPCGYQCRCGVMLMTIEAAARAGVQEAIDWLKNGRPPSKPEWRLNYIPFAPTAGFGSRGRVAISRMAVDAVGHNHKEKGPGGGQFTSGSGGGGGDKTATTIARQHGIKLKSGHAIKVQYDRTSKAKAGFKVHHTSPDKHRTDYEERFNTVDEAAAFGAAKLREHLAKPSKPVDHPKESELRDDKTPRNPNVQDVWTIPVGSLNVDAKRFQYKVKDIDADGVTPELLGVGKWNPELGGVLLVWRDPADKKDYVINGHHRHHLAKRHGAAVLNVRYITAPNAVQARARGALANIAEGRGSAIDAAKYLRDSGQDVEHLKDAGISLTGKVAAEATILKNLADKPFQMVALGTLEEAKAIAVAKHLKDHNLQNALFKKIEDRENDGKDWSNREIETAAKKMASSGKFVEHTQDLFGSFDDEHSTFDQEVELESFIGRLLSREAADFKAVSDQRRADRVASEGNVLAVDANHKRALAAQEFASTFEREASLRGPINKAIRLYAGELAQAKTKAQRESVKYKTFEAIKVALNEAA